MYHFDEAATAAFISLPFIAPIIISFVNRLYHPRNAPSMAYINTCAAGIFFGIAMFHVLPRVLLSTEDKIIFLCVSAGVIFMLTLDRAWIGRARHSDGSLIITATDASWAMMPEDGACNKISLPANRLDQWPKMQLAHKKLVQKRSVVISTYVAFCFHSIIAGFAIGSQNVSTSVLLIVIVFTFHKSLDAAAITTQLIKIGMGMYTYWALIFIFSCMAPAGIIISMHMVKGVALLMNLTAAFSSGIFIYISLMHILDEEIHSDTGKTFYKILTFTLGVFLAYITSLP